MPFHRYIKFFFEQKMNLAAVSDLCQSNSIDTNSRSVADEFFSRGDWLSALHFYQAIDVSAISSSLLLQIAECHYRLGEYEAAFFASKKATQFHQSLLRAHQLHSHAAKALGRLSDWVESATFNYKHSPDHSDYALDYADAALFGMGDVVAARQLVCRYVDHPVHAERAQWLNLMSLVFDRSANYSAHQLTADFRHFASKYIRPQAEGLLSAKTESKLSVTTARTIGFISPFFMSGAVSVVVMKKLKTLQESGHRLVFFYRGGRVDSVTVEMKSLATRWIDCAHFNVLQLNRVLFDSKLDELYDLSGWMDLDVLKAISSKPVLRQFKWVGGQLCSTGLDCYDGLITDTTLTPPSSYSLYTEPLLSPGAFRSEYAPPEYIPEPRMRQCGHSLRRLKQCGEVLLGVCAPAHFLSRDFLAALDEFFRTFSSTAQLCFIDSTFVTQQAKNRVYKALGLVSPARIKFVVPPSHEELLRAMNQLDLLIDTFPHSSGVRLLEARHLKLPVHLFSFDRQLFCERLALTYTAS
jgi:predicted O-linked N-acetylglucosamine transferase (SPINDLY family)